MLGRSVLLEEAGYSLLGPLALNCAAPDEGNLHLLDKVATAGTAQARSSSRWPGADLRSAFAMTEPPPGAGSDPSALRTVADAGRRRVGHQRREVADHRCRRRRVLHRDGPHRRGRPRCSSSPATTRASHVGEHASTIDASMPGGHCRVTFDDCRVAADAVLGEVDEGFRYAQVRLAPARLTHCMRWLGAARSAHDIAMQHAVDRASCSAASLADLGMAQQLIADNEIDLHTSRLVLWQACWAIDNGSRGGEESSRAKVMISEAVNRVVDRSVQLAGGMGTSEEQVLGRIYADIRAFRIYDGASEVHRMSLAKRAVRRASA